jgi:hypothetical protein
VTKQLAAHSVRALIPTSGATLDVTGPTSRGTPIGAILLADRNRSSDASLADISHSWGVVDGTNEFVVSNWSKDNEADSTSGQAFLSTACLQLIDPSDPSGTRLATLSFNSFILGGVRLNIDQLPPSLLAVTVLLIFGDDLDATAFNAAAPGAGSPTTVTTGHPVHAILTMARHVTTAGDRAKFQLGIATQSAQAVTGFCINDGTPSSEAVRFHYPDRISIDHDHSSHPGSVAGANKVENFTSTGFDIAEFSGAVGPGTAVIGLAINCGLTGVHVETSLLSPNTTGVVDYDEAGFYPETIYLPVGGAGADSTLQTVGLLSLGVYAGRSSGSPDQDAYAARERNGATVTDSSDRVASSKIVHLRNHSTDALIKEADVDGRDADGFQLDWTTAGNPQRFFSYLVLQRITDSVGDATLVINTAGSGTVQNQALAGFAICQATVTGNLVNAGAVEAADGAIAGTSSTSGDLAGTGALEGTSAGQASTSGDLVAAGSVAATVTGQASTSGDLTGAGALASAVAGQAATTGDLSSSASIAGTIAGQATTTGSIENAAAGAVAGTTAGAASTSGDLVGTGALVGVVAGQATATAASGGVVRIAGTIGGTSTVTGAATVLSRIIALVEGVASTAAALAASAALVASIAATSSASGDLSGTGALQGATAGAATLVGQGSGAPVAEIRDVVSATGSRQVTSALVGQRCTIVTLAGTRTVSS